MSMHQHSIEEIVTVHTIVEVIIAEEIITKDMNQIRGVGIIEIIIHFHTIKIKTPEITTIHQALGMTKTIKMKTKIIQIQTMMMDYFFQDQQKDKVLNRIFNID